LKVTYIGNVNKFLFSSFSHIIFTMGFNTF